MKNLKKRTQGFTIIEVMIVLAIAGLIMLIVFLAIPALQRASRNTQRKTDAGRIGAAFTEATANNNGTFPTEAQLESQVNVSTLSFYKTIATIQFGAAAAAADTVANTSDIKVWTTALCATYAAVTGTNALGQGATSTSATSRQAAITYWVEAGGDPVPICNSI